jgi:GNAT superfamily N-acetyltransferase
MTDTRGTYVEVTMVTTLSDTDKRAGRSAAKIRPIAEADAPECGRIIYEAFRCIAERHNFPRDFPSVEVGVEIARDFARIPSISGVVAEIEGRVVGSNFLVEHDEIRAVGPITVDPPFQAHRVGRQLMEAVIDRGRSAAGIRLVQDAFNITSMSLYASLGFEVKEPLALMRGKPASRPSGKCEVRALGEQDLEGCAALCRAVHGIDRSNELRGCIGKFSPMVLLREGRVAAYCSAPTFWIFNHGVAETEDDMKELLLGATAANAEPLFLLVPIRQASFFRWCLDETIRTVKPMTLMTMGKYQEPRGCFFPSVFY